MAKAVSIRHVRVFRNGRNQAIRIPREFELPGKDALLHQDDRGRLIIEPTKTSNLLSLLSSWGPLQGDDAMPAIKKLPAEPVRF